MEFGCPPKFGFDTSSSVLSCRWILSCTVIGFCSIIAVGVGAVRGLVVVVESVVNHPVVLRVLLNGPQLYLSASLSLVGCQIDPQKSGERNLYLY